VHIKAIRAAVLLVATLALLSWGPGNRLAADESGVVAGRAYRERARPTGPDLPLAGVEVMVVPRSKAFLERLEFIKAHARDSLQTYEAAAFEITLARDAYEKELRDTGRAEEVFKAEVNPDGTFSMAWVPAGAWTVIAVTSVVTRLDRNLDKKLDKDAARFVPTPRLKAVRDLTVWLRDVTVAAGEPAALEIELTDRNLWYRGPVVERTLLRPAPPGSRR
jgi:hypothetical protein